MNLIARRIRLALATIALVGALAGSLALPGGDASASPRENCEGMGGTFYSRVTYYDSPASWQLHYGCRFDDGTRVGCLGTMHPRIGFWSSCWAA
jgi:hypothetical protein